MKQGERTIVRKKVARNKENRKGI